MPEGVLVLYGLSRVRKSRVCDSMLQGANGNVMGIYDFLCLPKSIDAEVQEEPHLNVRSTLQRLPIYYTPPATADIVILDPTQEGLAVSTPSDIDDESDGDDDAYVEILLVTSSFCYYDPFFRKLGDVSGDAVHVDFFLFLLVHIMSPIFKMALLGIASLLIRSGMLGIVTTRQGRNIRRNIMDIITTQWCRQ
nr:hypothetical protein [Tanacetum cinerariifolium]